MTSVEKWSCCCCCWRDLKWDANMLFVHLIRVNRVCPAGLSFSVTSTTPFTSMSSLYGRVFLVPAGLWSITGSCNAVWPVSVTCSPLFIIVLIGLALKEPGCISLKPFTFIWSHKIQWTMIKKKIGEKGFHFDLSVRLWFAVRHFWLRLTLHGCMCVFHWFEWGLSVNMPLWQILLKKIKAMKNGYRPSVAQTSETALLLTELLHRS